MAASVSRPAGARGRNAFRVSTGDPSGRSLLDPAGRRRAVRALHAATLAAALFTAGAVPAAAERLVASLSDRHVMITSNYSGVELVLFGSVERDTSSAVHSNPYDIVATVIGPRQTLRTRRKQRVLGIWVNTAARTFVDPPSYLAVLANRPLAAITSPESQKRLRLGIANTPLPESPDDDGGEVGDDPFRAALVRLMGERGLYSEAP